MIDKEQVVLAILDKKLEHKNSIAFLERMNPDVKWADKMPAPSDNVLLWKIFSDEIVRYLEAEDRESWNKDAAPAAAIQAALCESTAWLAHFGFHEALDAVNSQKKSEQENGEAV